MQWGGGGGGGGSRYTIIYTHEFVKKNPRLLELDTGLY